MIWSEHDFEREVRRQLVELASIRKRVASDEDMVRKLDQLEVSHRMLLRKISEYFRRKESGDGQPSAASPPVIFVALESYLRAVVEGRRLSGEADDDADDDVDDEADDEADDVDGEEEAEDDREGAGEDALDPADLEGDPSAGEGPGAPGVEPPGALTPCGPLTPSGEEHPRGGEARPPAPKAPAASSLELEGAPRGCLASGLLPQAGAPGDAEDAVAEEGDAGAGCGAPSESVQESLAESLQEALPDDAPPDLPPALVAALQKGLAAAGIAPRMPDIHGRCLICDGLLLSSLLAGDEIVLHAKAWYHRSCVAGKSRVKPGAFN